MVAKDIKIKFGKRVIREIKSEYGGFYIGDQEVHPDFIQPGYRITLIIPPEERLSSEFIKRKNVRDILADEEEAEALANATAFAVRVVRSKQEESIENQFVPLRDLYDVFICFATYKPKED